MISSKRSDAKPPESVPPKDALAPLQRKYGDRLAATRWGSILMMQVFWMASLSSSGPLSRAGNAVIVIATESHRESLLPRLQAHGLDIAAAIEQGRYISLDAADTLSTFMVNDHA